MNCAKDYNIWAGRQYAFRYILLSIADLSSGFQWSLWIAQRACKLVIGKNKHDLTCFISIRGQILVAQVIGLNHAGNAAIAYITAITIAASKA
jgi:hypothetical protein